MKLIITDKIDEAKNNFIQAANFVNDTLNAFKKDQNVLNFVPDSKIYKQTNLAGNEIKKCLLNFLNNHDEIKISFYRSSFFYRSVVANVKGGSTDKINFNIRHESFLKHDNETTRHDIAHKVNTYAHEWSHLADNFEKYLNFGHEKHYSIDRDSSFPYLFGRLFESYYLIKTQEKEF